MRKQHKEWPERHERRAREGFLLFPKRIGMETRWLERTRWEERCQYFERFTTGLLMGYDWLPVRWLD